MAQPDRNSQSDNKRGNEPNFNWRGVILIAIAFGLIGLALLVPRRSVTHNVEDVPYNRFLELLDNKQIVNDKNFPLPARGRGRPPDPDISSAITASRPPAPNRR